MGSIFRFYSLGLGVLIVGLTLTGCAGEDPATDAIVTIDATDTVAAEIESLVIRVQGAPNALAPLEPPTERTFTREYDTLFPREVAIAPFDKDAARIFRLQVTGLDTLERTVIESTLVSGYVSGKTVRFHVLLHNSCRGLSCNENETCARGICQSAEVNPLEGLIDTPQPVTLDPELPTECSSDPDCDDSQVCNGTERCVEGACQIGSILRCSDGIECTEDICTANGCTAEPNDSRCTLESGGTCTEDGCQYADCNETTCVSDGCFDAVCEGNKCVRTSLCGETEMCCGGACVPLDCDDNNPCTFDTCFEGSCQNQAKTGDACNDGNACTSEDTCLQGICRGEGTVSCGTSANPCVAVTCQPESGCVEVFVEDGTSCADADLCSGAEVCSDGECIEGAPVACDDGIACTSDSCDPNTGGCVSTADDAACTAEANGSCDPDNGCQYPLCNATNCADDTGSCTVASCAGDQCVRTSLCSDSETCCGGECVSLGCDDGNPCTSDSCTSTGCAHIPDSGAACSDNNACTVNDRCENGLCVAGASRFCVDTNDCTQDSCDPNSGCTFSLVDGPLCEDGNACTFADRCVEGTCVGGAPVACGISTSECVATSCDPVQGCVETPVVDGTACGSDTLNQECVGFFCKDGICGQVAADDGTRCTGPNPLCIYRCWSGFCQEAFCF
ncbi:MAG: hypothetical protein AAF355_15390 [Myxococcota bacterium]